MSTPRPPAMALAVFSAADAVACAIPLRVLKADLDRLGCPPGVQRAIPVVKAAAAVGLVAGRRRPALGTLTAAALVGYFACAVGAHVRVGDHPIRAVPAVALGAVSLATALRSYR